MNSIHINDTHKPAPTHLLLAVDVSKRRLDAYSRYEQGRCEYDCIDSFANDVPTIDAKLAYYGRQALALGYQGLDIVVEPTGRHEQKLTQAAHARGHTVWMVNPEHMYKAGVIHHGDDGKSDPLDGQVLHMMARMGKVSRWVPLPMPWQKLRSLGQWLEDATLAAADVRIRIIGLRRELFVDYQQSTDLTWGATGKALQEVFGFDPWAITQGTYHSYARQMRGYNPRIPERGLAGIWQQALQSGNVECHPQQRALLLEQLTHLWRNWEYQEQRKHELGVQMVGLVNELDPEHWIPPLWPGFSQVMRAKILAETGPLRGFPHWRALVAYAGLKIRMRASGTYRGKDRITKKGRILLRKHLGQATFTLTRKDRLLGPYYHRKLGEGMPPRKAKVACMRKLVKILYGTARSKQEFSKERVYRSAG